MLLHHLRLQYIDKSKPSHWEIGPATAAENVSLTGHLYTDNWKNLSVVGCYPPSAKLQKEDPKLANGSEERTWV